MPRLSRASALPRTSNCRWSISICREISFEILDCRVQKRRLQPQILDQIRRLLTMAQGSTPGLVGFDTQAVPSHRRGKSIAVLTQQVSKPRQSPRQHSSHVLLAFQVGRRHVENVVQGDFPATDALQKVDGQKENVRSGQ